MPQGREDSHRREYSLTRALADRWREALRIPNFRDSFLQAARDAWEFLLDSTPARQRQRWGDIEFDCDNRVNTTSAGQSFLTRFRAALAGGPYQPSEPALFHEMLGALSIDPTQFTFIDIGSGKGRALLMAADYPFRRIIGIELLPELHHVALDNLRQYQSHTQECVDLQAICGDARTFPFPAEPTVLYLF